MFERLSDGRLRQARKGKAEDCGVGPSEHSSYAHQGEEMENVNHTTATLFRCSICQELVEEDQLDYHVQICPEIEQGTSSDGSPEVLFPGQSVGVCGQSFVAAK